jgi:predicted amidohydrolase YtcJ
MPGLPNRIEHAQILSPSDIARFAQLGVVASMQPIHATEDMPTADRLWGQRSAYAYAWRSLKDAGALLAFGSDAPVESPNPWWGIHAAVTRQRRDGTPTGGWYPEQRLTVQESLEAYCTGPAVCSGEADFKGVLRVGALADLAVLSADPFHIPPEALPGITALLTLVDGKVAWQSAEC